MKRLQSKGKESTHRKAETLMIEEEEKGILGGHSLESFLDTNCMNKL